MKFLLIYTVEGEQVLFNPVMIRSLEVNVRNVSVVFKDGGRYSAETQDGIIYTADTDQLNGFFNRRTSDIYRINV